MTALGDAAEKEAFWEVCLELKPDYRRESFDRHWDEFIALRERAKELKSLGLAIHPTFATLFPHPR